MKGKIPLQVALFSIVNYVPTSDSPTAERGTPLELNNILR
jgi:hypothetical protein